jgi:hypothetical protein
MKYDRETSTALIRRGRNVILPVDRTEYLCFALLWGPGELETELNDRGESHLSRARRTVDFGRREAT